MSFQSSDVTEYTRYVKEKHEMLPVSLTLLHIFALRSQSTWTVDPEAKTLTYLFSMGTETTQQVTPHLEVHLKKVETEAQDTTTS